MYNGYGYPGYASGYSYNPYGYGLNAYGGLTSGAVVASAPATVVAIAPTVTSIPATTAATATDPNAGGFAEKGEASFKSGDYAGAETSWRHAVVDNPQNPVLGLMLGQALLATGKYDEAAGVTQTAMSQLPKDKWNVVVANSRELYGNYQDYTAHIRALESAARTKPNDPAIRFLMGYHYAYLGYPQQAIDQLDKVLSVNPNDTVAKQLRDEMKSKLPNAAPTGVSGLPPSPAAPLSTDVPGSVPLPPLTDIPPLNDK